MAFDLFDLPAMLATIIGAKSAKTVDICHHTKLERWTIEVWVGGKETQITLPEIEAMPTQSWADELRKQLSALGGENVVVKNHENCETCSGEVSIRAQFPNGLQFGAVDPLDHAELLAQAAGYNPDA